MLLLCGVTVTCPACIRVTAALRAIVDEQTRSVGSMAWPPGLALIDAARAALAERHRVACPGTALGDTACGTGECVAVRHCPGCSIFGRREEQVTP